jgi:hypothetical protein
VGEREAQGPRDQDRIIDLARAAQPGSPPVAGAQWDELHLRWEIWDEAAHAWMVVGDESGELIRPGDDAPLPPPLLARELIHAEEIDPVERHVIDVDRLAAPPQPVPGAQWNEVLGRWERWDDAAGAWVEAVAGAEISG